MNGKFNLVKFLFVFTLVSGISSCDKNFLQTVPTDLITGDIALGSTDNMMMILNGVHRSLYAQSEYSSLYAGQQFMIPTAEYAASDLLHSRLSGGGWHQARSQWMMHTYATRSDVTFCWFMYYNIIGSVNNIINAADGLQMSDELHNVLGQAYTYRAWSHFELVKNFAKAYMIGDPSTDPGVPVMLTNEHTYKGKERASVQAVYDQIISDLNTALDHFAEASPRQDLSHLNIDVANGVAARVYLTIGNWTSAALHARAARQDYTLMNEAEYKAGFGSWDNPEWIWGSKVIEEQTTYYRSYFYFCSNNFNGSQNRGNPKIMNHLLYAQIPATDYRKDQVLANCPSTFENWDEGQNAGRYASEADFIDSIALYRSIVNNTEYHNMVPYMHIKLYQDNGPSIDPRDVLHMRAAEMYLVEAEALARQGGANEALARQVLYELVSERDKGYVMSTNTGLALIDEILLQRRIELFLEGHRWFDMLRNDEVLDRAGTGANPNLYFFGMYQDRPSVNDTWIFRIPQSEIDANPLMVQNDYLWY